MGKASSYGYCKARALLPVGIDQVSSSFPNDYIHFLNKYRSVLSAPLFVASLRINFFFPLSFQTFKMHPTILSSLKGKAISYLSSYLWCPSPVVE